MWTCIVKFTQHNNEFKGRTQKTYWKHRGVVQKLSKNTTSCPEIVYTHVRTQNTVLKLFRFFLYLLKIITFPAYKTNKKHNTAMKQACDANATLAWKKVIHETQSVSVRCSGFTTEKVQSRYKLLNHGQLTTGPHPRHTCEHHTEALELGTTWTNKKYIFWSIQQVSKWQHSLCLEHVSHEIINWWFSNQLLSWASVFHKAISRWF